MGDTVVPGRTDLGNSSGIKDVDAPEVPARARELFAELKQRLYEKDFKRTQKKLTAYGRDKEIRGRACRSAHISEAARQRFYRPLMMI